LHFEKREDKPFSSGEREDKPFSLGEKGGDEGATLNLFSVVV
jgi:hypothetical protein